MHRLKSYYHIVQHNEQHHRKNIAQKLQVQFHPREKLEQQDLTQS